MIQSAEFLEVHVLQLVFIIIDIGTVSAMGGSSGKDER
jgi:hypothetical protein